MINDLVLRWVVTAFFVMSAAECAYSIATDPRSWARNVAQSLHFLMAVAMILMAWPSGAELPTTGPMLFFVAAAAWFVVMVIMHSDHRGVNAYHAAMMAAMGWMYAVMSGTLVPQPAQIATGADNHGTHHMPSMPGMNMPDVSGTTADAQSPLLITVINWLWVIGFALATCWWLYRFTISLQAGRAAQANQCFGAACQAMMAAGMAIMFAVML